MNDIRKGAWAWILRQYFYLWYALFFFSLFAVGAFRDILPYFFFVLKISLLITGGFEVFTSGWISAQKTIHGGAVIPTKYVPSRVAFGGIGLMVGALLWFEISSALGLVEASDLDMLLWLVFMILGIIYGISADKALDKSVEGFVNLRIY